MLNINDRMKENYENRAKTYLTRRTPVIIRIDGKSFHSFTKNFQRPYDEVFHQTMNDTTKYLCENIQNCKLAYTESDEISLLLIDYDTLETDAWFDYSVQKLCSVSASMATLAFNKYFSMNIILYEQVNNLTNLKFGNSSQDYEKQKILNAYYTAEGKGAMFDARCFNIPEDEVTNYFISRQQDATNNAIQMLGQANFSHKQLENKNCSNIQDMLMLEKNINFNDMPTIFKRGACCIKDNENKWFIDNNIPIFTKNREYIDKSFKE